MHFEQTYVRRKLGAPPPDRLIVELPPGYVRAAVLVPLIYAQATPELLLTKRTSHVETHKGQIAFPGGVVDDGDRDAVATALRETEEELGIRTGSIETLALLDDLMTPTGFVITPVVGLLQNLPAMKPNEAEVEDVFTVPLHFFAEPGEGRMEERVVRGTVRRIWLYEYGGHTIWGATAAIVRSLLQSLGTLSREG